MGRVALLTSLTLALAACASEPLPRAQGEAHAALACTECHQGGVASVGEPAVPPETCTGSACHETDIPGEVSLETVRFPHRGHGSGEQLAVGCAGCHTHDRGSEPLSAGPETCGLCHVDELSGARGEDCRLCHTQPTHEGATNQGVSIAHRGLPWIEGGCLRCHYQVARPVHEVSLDRCAECHGDVADVTEAGIGEDLHPEHVGNACADCHEADNHRIEAMSSAVELVCADCHETVHGTDVDHAWLDPVTCTSCHRQTHQGPQRLLLGVLPTGTAANPSDHFMDGLTCRSCHIPVGRSGEEAGRGTRAACAACHRPEYATVLDWWRQGLEERSRLVDRYLSAAEARTGDDATSAASLVEARANLDLVRSTGGQHNLRLAHRLFGDALDRAAQAYRNAGLTPPETPQLGRAPRQGLCSYCHYRLVEPGLSEDMSDAFHREIMGR